MAYVMELVKKHSKPLYALQGIGQGSERLEE